MLSKLPKRRSRQGVDYPYVHDLAQLLTLVHQGGQEVPESVKQAAKLTRYAIVARYPGALEPVTQEEYKEAVAIAEEVVRWVGEIVGRG